MNTTDEAVHGYYIGYKYQKMLKHSSVTDAKRQQLKELAYTTLLELYENEIEYAHDLYEAVGLVDQVLKYMEINADRALRNLGYEPLFGTLAQDVNPIVLKGLSNGVNHDFFSLAGSSYTMLDTGEVSPETTSLIKAHFNVKD